MKPYRYYLAITSQFYFCGIPFRLDTVPKCPLNCSYCFAMSRGGRHTSTRLLAKPAHLSDKFGRLDQDGSDNGDITAALLKQKMPVHFGGMSDPFANPLVSATSLELLSVLADHDYPTVISTKNTEQLLQPAVQDVLHRFRHLVIQISLSALDPEFSRIVEPNIPTPAQRLAALESLGEAGFYTIVRLQPLFPENIRAVEQDLIPRIAQTRVRHVIVEFLKLPLEHQRGRTQYLFDKLHWHLANLYTSKFALRTGREWVLLPQYKWELLQPLINAIHIHGMTYGAGDYGLNHLGDTNCCCGIDVVDGFSGWFAPNLAHLIRQTKDSTLDIGILDGSAYPNKSIRMYMNSNCRNDQCRTIYDFMKLKWNRPGSENAPDSFLGVSFDDAYDDLGNCIYTKNLI